MQFTRREVLLPDDSKIVLEILKSVSNPRSNFFLKGNKEIIQSRYREIFRENLKKKNQQKEFFEKIIPGD